MVQDTMKVRELPVRCESDDEPLIVYKLRHTLFLVMCPKIDLGSVKNRNEVVRDVRSALEEIARERKCGVL